MESSWIDDWSDSTEDREFLESAESDDGDSVDLISCPECGADIYEESEQCPSCGAFVIHDNNPLLGRPIWWVILGLLGIAAVIVVLSL